jgi:hypothetical protein
VRVPGRRVIGRRMLGRRVLRRRVPVLRRRVTATRRAARPASGPQGPALPLGEPARQPRATAPKPEPTRPEPTRPKRRRRQRSELPHPVGLRPGVVVPAGRGAIARQKRLATTQVPATQVAAMLVAAMQVAPRRADRTRLAAQPQRRPGRLRRRLSSRRSSSSSPRMSPPRVRQSPRPSRNDSSRPGRRATPMTTQTTAAAATTARQARQAGAGAVAVVAGARALAPRQVPGLTPPTSQARRTRGLTTPQRIPASPTRMARARRPVLLSAVAAVAAPARAPRPT